MRTKTKDGANKKAQRTLGPLEAAGAAGNAVEAWLYRLGDPSISQAAARKGRRGLLITTATAVVASALVFMVLGLNVAVAALHVVAGQAPAAGPIAPNGRIVKETMVIETGKMDKRPGWPRFVPASFTVAAGDTVVLKIVNHDDGTAPLAGAQAMFASVQGTAKGTESINGTVVHAISAENVSHTFTLLGLGVNVPVPAAPQGGTTTVIARFVASKTGVFLWQCYAPCGTGPNAMGGAMSTSGWMEGTVRVTP